MYSTDAAIKRTFGEDALGHNPKSKPVKSGKLIFSQSSEERIITKMNDVFYYSLSFNLCILLFHFIPLSLPLTLFHLPLPLLFFVTLFFQLLLFFNFFKFLQLIGNSILYFFLFIQQYKSPFFPCCLLFVSLFLPLFFISQFIFFCSSASFFLCISSSSSALLSSVPLLLGFLCSFPPSTCT